MSRKRRLMVSVIALVLIGAMLLGLLAAGIVSVFAAGSDEIKSQIEALEDEAAEIARKRDELQSEIDSTRSEAKSIAQQKSEIDRSVELTRQEVANLEAQIQEYNRLIAEKQQELDELLAEEGQLHERYRLRLRAMEENGTTVSYWSILFNANNFSDLVDRLEMIREIENSDRLMLQQIKDSADRVAASRETLAAEKITLSEKRVELAQAEEELLAQRNEADRLVQELNASLKDMRETEAEYEAKENDLVASIAKKEQEYQAALDQEEEERRREEEAAQGNNGSNNPGNSGNSGGSGGSGWTYPLPAGTSSVTCAYGWRIHPTTGNYSFHSGVDLGAGYGVPIYASRSGTVTTAEYSDVYGNYVTINHGDGFSSLYAHMTYSTVRYGEHVDRGEVIGYVGSTGWSTGPHLHFTIYYYGNHVNPMNYISVR